MILDDLVVFMAADLADLTDATNLFAAELPDTPDKAVVIREYSGPPPIETFANALEAQEVYAIQVTTRALDTVTARKLAHKVNRSLRAIGRTTSMASGVAYSSCLPNQMPFPLTMDDDERVHYVQNFTLYRDAPTSV